MAAPRRSTGGQRRHLRLARSSARYRGARSRRDRPRARPGVASARRARHHVRPLESCRAVQRSRYPRVCRSHLPPRVSASSRSRRQVDASARRRRCHSPRQCRGTRRSHRRRLCCRRDRTYAERAQSWLGTHVGEARAARRTRIRSAYHAFSRRRTFSSLAMPATTRRCCTKRPTRAGSPATTPGGTRT